MNRQSSIPDIAEVIARYRQHAAGYDASARRTMWIRERAIARLDLRRGDRVLDIACGTGLSLPGLRHAVGHAGEVIGIEVSPDMIGHARDRVRSAGWRNVVLLESAVEASVIPGPLDAVLFHFTHDVLRSPVALAHVFAAAARGARVVMAGMKYAPWWMGPVNWVVRAKARPYMTSLEGLAAPWDLAVAHMESFNWQPVLYGTAYIGWGRARGDDGA